MNRRTLLPVLMAMAFPFMMSGEIVWLESEYNFGAFREADGLRTGHVRFVNDSDAPTFVAAVKPSCGCTSVDYPKGQVNPGDTVTVSFTYDPTGRPGPFDKTVRVYTGDERSPKVIRITGTVIGSPETLDNIFPEKAGSVRLETFRRNLGEVKSNDSRHGFINVYNQSSDTVRPAVASHSDALVADITPKTVPPGELATIGLYLSGSKTRQAGPVEYDVDFIPDTKSSGNDWNRIVVGATIVPDSRTMSVEEIESAPAAFLVPEFVDLGEAVNSGEIPFQFSVLNDGKTALEVRRVYSQNSNVKIKKVPGKIKSGKTSPVKGVIDTSSLDKGPFRIEVEVITNDPMHPVRTAYIVGIRI